MAVSTAPPVQPVAPLRRGQIHVVRAGEQEVVRLDHEQVLLLAQAERGRVERRPVAAMAVAEHQPPDAGARQRRAVRLHDRAQQRGIQADGAGEARVLAARPDRHGRQHPGREVVRQVLEGARQQAAADVQVGGEGQVRAVLLEGGQRQHDHRVALGQPRGLDRGQRLPVAGFH